MHSFLHPLLRDPRSVYTLRNTRSGRPVATRLEIAFDSRSRRRGLLGRDRLAPLHALILAPCSSVHTFFMRFPIDVVFATREGRIVKTYRALPAWRIGFAFNAFAAIELPAGTVDVSGARPGDLLDVILVDRWPK